MPKKGAFVVVEGLDGSGKTTQARILAAKLRVSHHSIYTAEPSRGEIGKFIRTGLLYKEMRPPTSIEALLFAADRIDHIQKEVQPALNSGHVIISDRYLYSSLAYQGSTGLDLEWIRAVNVHALKPDLALFIDVDPEAVQTRLKQRKSVMEDLETQRKVRSLYLQFVKKGELIRVDGSKSKQNVAEYIFAIVSRFLAGRA